MEAHFTFSRTKHMETQIMVRRGSRSMDTKDLLPSDSLKSQHYLLTDSNVDKLYGDEVLAHMKNDGLRVRKLVMPAGEDNKSLEVFCELARTMCQDMDKKSFVFSLGGGVVNNMAGMLAACMYRGIGLIHIPTTVMAQVDAAIDFKQAVNTGIAKNLCGAYYPARWILIDPQFLTTMDTREIRNGLGESVKHALTQDSEMLEWMVDNAHRVRDVDFLQEVVERTLALKVPTLNGDTNDDFNEMVPQYGHCLGHAVEYLSEYKLGHGEAVGIGMCLTAELAHVMGLCDLATVQAHYRACRAFKLPVTLPASISASKVLHALKYDKHFVHKKPTIGLLTQVGTMYQQEDGTYGVSIDVELVEKAIAANLQRASTEDRACAKALSTATKAAPEAISV